MTSDAGHRQLDSIERTSELDYALPKELIAQQPSKRREDARLLMVDRTTGKLRDGKIVELPEVLGPGDLVVLNDSKVLPAKFRGRRASGGAVDGLFVEEEQPGVWRVMLRGSKRLGVGEALSVPAARGAPATLRLRERYGQGHWRVQVEAEGSLEQILDRIGSAPLPPYIRRQPGEPLTNENDRRRYQTVYARRSGAIAAPTAGLHFTDELLDRLGKRGVETAFVTLHVGLGTFKPITTEKLSDHVMHRERYELTQEAADAVNACRRRGGRIVAVGTTSVRVLESAANEDRTVNPGRGSTDLFIYPPHEFRVVDALLTNFHLPQSTLLALVMAFAGIETTRRAYAHAIQRRYRFYSYGDAMWIC